MKVSELIAALKTVPQDMEVLVSSDEEGNSFHVLYQVSKEPMAPTDKMRRFWDYDDSVKTDSVVLWPA